MSVDLPTHTDPVAREGLDTLARVEYDGGPMVSLRHDIIKCHACPMREECSFPTPPWPRSDPAKVMMIGRNPGINEDQVGLPFVGRGGQLFQAWLRGLEITREDIWLTNLLKCYSLKDRKPKKSEINTCFSLHLKREIEWCRPQLIIPMGAEAFAAMTGLDKLTQRHGILYDRRRELGAYVMGIIHPGSALRDASYKHMMIEDGQQLKPLLHFALQNDLIASGPPLQYQPQ